MKRILTFCITLIIAFNIVSVAVASTPNTPTRIYGYYNSSNAKKVGYDGRTVLSGKAGVTTASVKIYAYKMVFPCSPIIITCDWTYIGSKSVSSSDSSDGSRNGYTDAYAKLDGISYGSLNFYRIKGTHKAYDGYKNYTKYTDRTVTGLSLGF